MKKIPRAAQDITCYFSFTYYFSKNEQRPIAYLHVEEKPEFLDFSVFFYQTLSRSEIP